MRRTAAALFLALACSTRTAVAQAPAPSPPAPAPAPAPPAPERSLGETLQGAASDAYTSAKMLMNNKDFAGALAKFRQAYDLAKDPRLLYDMAICERSLRAYARMQSLLEQYEREASSSISVEDKTTVDDALVAIKGLVGTVSVSVSEAGATVAVDGESVGVTPLAQPVAIDLGPHKVTISKAGFDTIEKTLDVAGGTAIDLSLTLAPQVHEAHLLVTSSSDATVSIDGQVVGKSRFDGPLASGTHEVRVSEAGWLPYMAHVELRDGESRSMEVTLEREHPHTLLPWLIGGAAVVAGAAVAGYFLFKSPDTPGNDLTGRFGTITFN